MVRLVGRRCRRDRRHGSPWWARGRLIEARSRRPLVRLSPRRAEGGERLCVRAAPWEQDDDAAAGFHHRRRSTAASARLSESPSRRATGRHLGRGPGSAVRHLLCHWAVLASASASAFVVADARSAGRTFSRHPGIARRRRDRLVAGAVGQALVDLAPVRVDAGRQAGEPLGGTPRTVAACGRQHLYGLFRCCEHRTVVSVAIRLSGRALLDCLGNDGCTHLPPGCQVGHHPTGPAPPRPPSGVGRGRPVHRYVSRGATSASAAGASSAP